MKFCGIRCTNNAERINASRSQQQFQQKHLKVHSKLLKRALSRLQLTKIVMELSRWQCRSTQNKALYTLPIRGHPKSAAFWIGLL